MAGCEGCRRLASGHQNLVTRQEGRLEGEDAECTPVPLKHANGCRVEMKSGAWSRFALGPGPARDAAAFQADRHTLPPIAMSLALAPSPRYRPSMRPRG